MEEVPQAIVGKWYWKDETSSLEFQPNVIQSIDSKDKRSKKKTLLIGDHATKRDRLTPNRFDSKPGGGGAGVGGATKSQRHGLVSRSAKSPKGAEKETVVTLARVKSVTLNLLNEVNVNTEFFEKALCSVEQFDEFLHGLLNYFAAFFDKLLLSKPKQSMTTEPSQAELRATAEIEASMAQAQRKLAQSYCVLVLGIGLPENHHMGCGEHTPDRVLSRCIRWFHVESGKRNGQRVSSTYKDREMYESLYRFCVHFVWIVFSRKEHKLISREVGRLLRSDVFNPALRVKHAPADDAENLKEERKQFLEASKLTPAERRRQMEKRPAITSIVNKRSPVIVSLLPTPREKDGWLFDRMDLDPTESKKEGTLEKPAPVKKNVGIIGEPLNLFNATTLAPLGSEQDEENSDETQSKNDAALTGTPTNNGQSKGIGRQLTAQSQATDMFSDDEEQ